MDTRTRSQRIYDHRLKNLVRETGDIQLAVERGVPRSTAQGWLCPASREVVTLDILDTREKQLQHEVLILRGRNENLRAALRILVAVLRLSGFSLAKCRIADSEKNAKLLRQ